LPSRAASAPSVILFPSNGAVTSLTSEKINLKVFEKIYIIYKVDFLENFGE
jgi:hypothetical protein